MADFRLKFTGVFLLALVLAALEVLRPWPIQWVIDYPKGCTCAFTETT